MTFRETFSIQPVCSGGFIVTRDNYGISKYSHVLFDDTSLQGPYASSNNSDDMTMTI